MKDSKCAVIIPARYASTRFPGKPLALLAGKPMIRHVCEKAAASKAGLVAVATDDRRIADAVEAFGGTAEMTSPSHPSGTDRIAEALGKLGGEYDLVINVQGDEPLIPTSVIDELIDAMRADPALPPKASTASAMRRSSVATATMPALLAAAFSQTCCIIGFPARSARGFPGKRVLA